MIHSVLAGLLVGVAGLWGWYAFNRFQRGWLLEVAQEAMDAAESQGLPLQRTGFRPRIVARGTLSEGPASGQPVRVEWRTGILGPRTVVRTPDGRRRLPLVRTPAQLRDALSG